MDSTPGWLEVFACFFRFFFMSTFGLFLFFVGCRRCLAVAFVVVYLFACWFIFLWISTCQCFTPQTMQFVNLDPLFPSFLSFLPSLIRLFLPSFLFFLIHSFLLLLKERKFKNHPFKEQKSPPNKRTSKGRHCLPFPIRKFWTSSKQATTPLLQTSTTTTRFLRPLSPSVGVSQPDVEGGRVRVVVLKVEQ